MNQNGNAKVHIAICVDHKFFQRLKRWALGCILKISIYNENKQLDPIHHHFFIDLVDVSSTWVEEKSPQKTAVYIKKMMLKLNLWNRKDLPDFNICMDGGLSFAIIRHLVANEWENANSSVVTCEGHTSVNLTKISLDQVKNCIKNKIFPGKFFTPWGKIVENC